MSRKIYGRPVATPFNPEKFGSGGGMSEAELQAAIDTALAQAKASGEFDGFSIHYCSWDRELSIGGTLTSTESHNYFPNTTPVKNDLFVTKSGYVARARAVGHTTTSGGDQAIIVDYALVADLNGAPGYTPVKGTDYFTEADKQEIAEQAAELVEVPTDAHINSLINTALGVIENGTY